jgi:hypothetical protein
MKKMMCLVLLVFPFAIFNQAKAAQLTKKDPVLLNEAMVCFVDFRIGLVVGKSESDIGDSKYCRYAVDRKKFLSLLTSVPASTFYMSNNVRAKISLSTKDVYFIDYNGVVRLGDERFKISKKAFTEAIREIEKDKNFGW